MVRTLVIAIGKVLLKLICKIFGNIISDPLHLRTKIIIEMSFYTRHIAITLWTDRLPGTVEGVVCQRLSTLT